MIVGLEKSINTLCDFGTRYSETKDNLSRRQKSNHSGMYELSLNKVWHEQK